MYHTNMIKGDAGQMARFKIRQIAEKQGAKNATDLMRKTGISYSLARELWKNTDLNLEIDTLRRIAEKLGVSFLDLFEPDNQPSP